MFQNGVGAVFPFRDKRIRDTYIEIIGQTSGIWPSARRDTEHVHRALYEPATTRTILNVSTLRVLERLGRPNVVMTLEVDDPHKAALKAKELFAAAGQSSDVIDSADAEVDIPAGFMYFVVPVTSLYGPTLLFWPKNPDPEIMKRIPKSEPW